MTSPTWEAALLLFTTRYFHERALERTPGPRTQVTDGAASWHLPGPSQRSTKSEGERSPRTGETASQKSKNTTDALPFRPLGWVQQVIPRKGTLALPCVVPTPVPSSHCVTGFPHSLER